MNKTDVKNYFDLHAASWDAEMIKYDDIISQILDCAGIGKDSYVLDVACGTGVLFPFYEQRKAKVVGIDISDEMCRIAREKFPHLEIISADAEEYIFNESFNAVMVYNAFPHFPDPENLIRILSGLLKEGGTLTVAHGMSRENILKRHSGSAHSISIELPEAEDLAEIMSKYLKVTTTISDDEKYIISAKKIGH